MGPREVGEDSEGFSRHPHLLEARPWPWESLRCSPAVMAAAGGALSVLTRGRGQTMGPDTGTGGRGGRDHSLEPQREGVGVRAQPLPLAAHR